jgi:hypothetical protein
MNARSLHALAALLLTACAAPMVEPQAPGATYEITMTRSWSEATHPLDWPGLTAHFTGGIGATHNDDYAMFGAGRTATPGLEVLSQKGMATPFDQELAAAKSAGTVGAIVQYGPIWTAGGTSSMQVRATDAFPLLSFANMVAPSPDWFTGVAAIRLKRNGQWIESETVTLYAWDSGTNAARTYKAEKIAVSPFVAITQSDAPMFMRGGDRIPVGTATIRKAGA